MARAKLTDLYKSLNDKPFIHENVETLQVKLGGDEKTELKISNQTDANGDVDLSNVTLEFKGQKYEKLEFKLEDILEDHGNEGKDALFVAETDDMKFEVEVNIEADYDQSDRIQDVEWRSLETFPKEKMNERKNIKRKDIHRDVPKPGDPATSIVDEKLEFKFEEVLEDHGNEGKDALFVAESDDKKFEVEVNIDANYDQSGIIEDVEWRSLETFPKEEKNEEKEQPQVNLNESMVNRFKRLANIKK